MIVQCPHCSDSILIESINCAIFRHASLKSNHQQISPHAPQSECELLIEHDLVYGCAKPFRIIQNKDTIEAVKCDYI